MASSTPTWHRCRSPSTSVGGHQPGNGRCDASITDNVTTARPGAPKQTYCEPVYAKVLGPGRSTMPALMATTDEADVLLAQLIDRGWVRFGEQLPLQSAGRLVVGRDRLRLVVDGQALLDDLNPYAPHGWWAAVDQLQGRCLVVILQAGDVDLADADAGERIAALVGTGRAAAAILPVETMLDS
jgi:hypothetical protein